MEIDTGTFFSIWFKALGVAMMGASIAIFIFGFIIIALGTGIPSWIKWRNLEEKNSLKDYALDTKRPLWKVT